MSEIYQVKGKLLVFEGGSSVGKTTVVRKVCDKYTEILYTREPGGTKFGENIRKAVQSLDPYPVGDIPSVLAYNSARAQLLEEVVCPALVTGRTVLMDRFWPSTVAYQGASGADPTIIRTICSIAVGETKPDVYLYLDLDPRIAYVRRYGKDDLDRHDIKAIEFHDRVRSIYKEVGKEIGECWVEVDASKSPDEVFSSVTGILRERNLVK